MLIALLLQYGFTAAAMWLQLRKRRGTQLAEGAELEHVTAMLEGEFLKADVQELAAWTDPESSPLSLSVRKTADLLGRSRHLAAWVRHQNNQGLTVPSCALVAKYRATVSVMGLGSEDLAPALPTAARSWAARWSVKSGARHKRPRVEEPVPLKERRSNVARNCSVFRSEKSSKTRPRNGGHIADHFSASFLLVLISGPKNGAAWRPQNRAQFSKQKPNLS